MSKCAVFFIVIYCWMKYKLTAHIFVNAFVVVSGYKNYKKSKYYETIYTSEGLFRRFFCRINLQYL